MTTLTSSPAPTTSRRPSVGTGLAVVGTVLAANGVLLGSRLFLDSRDYSEVAATPPHLAHCVLWTVCLVALSQLYPQLRVLRGSTGRSLPVPVLALAGVGAALDACARFVSAFVTPYLAEQSPELVDSTPDAVLLVPLLATGVVAMAGTAALGVTAWRRGIVGPAPAALLVVGGIAIPVLGPVSNVLLGGALVWIGLTARTSR